MWRCVTFWDRLCISMSLESTKRVPNPIARVAHGSSLFWIAIGSGNIESVSKSPCLDVIQFWSSTSSESIDSARKSRCQHGTTETAITYIFLELTSSWRRVTFIPVISNRTTGLKVTSAMSSEPIHLSPKKFRELLKLVSFAMIAISCRLTTLSI